MKKYDLFIGGEHVTPASGSWFDSENPYTAEPWAQIPEGNAEDVDKAARAAHDAFHNGPWSDMTPTQRGAILRRIGDVIAERAEQLAKVEVLDNGKLFSEMYGQLAYLPQWFYYFGGLADKIEGTVVPVDKKGYFLYTQRQPRGVVGIITPWNSPLMLLAWKLAPALAAGCTAVIKPSEFTSASTLEFAALLNDAGLPPGVVNVVSGYGRDVGAPLVEHPLIASVSFTGSDVTGRQINVAAAEKLKHVSLELGGKSPNIVFADADLDAAKNGVISGIFAATGQTCIAGSRLLVQDTIHDEFVSGLVELARSARMGDPMHESTDVGPITTEPQYAKVLDYIAIAKSEGADVALGGRAADRPECGRGRFVEPTILTNVRNGMRIAQEEVFGPVLSVIPFHDEEDALAIANDVRFGLGAGVWTSDIARAFRMSERITSGTVWVNTYRAVSFMAPFGGMKDSGIGRENGLHAIDEYLDTKSVWINTGAPTASPFVMR
ncbi:aldehyde dehydrogenase [Mycolicibacterium diernhoferi]|uniref:Carnitine dehydratase n=1 Tax=Mycolicibacterium diernhoferi TaxID=1801 RepID=A0A1Q4H5M3_9MYCO|nr:aldehyde dehydrogenase [Mycolicibacterium diernhoferi]OJZ62864.1 carnitine dehydratase [Mycolicibacterium diernhoferi]OPE47540.1 carnitine dehydratase [Mycolicibacterium diernhoferi]PEG54680.1 carnitine dehydratase [Mycolicibacterium diernhoferi]QYL22897.1 aldehyde dehydrogenase [Mycolicibacterium diernhoferi]